VAAALGEDCVELEAELPGAFVQIRPAAPGGAVLRRRIYD
jgi:hypothetical protein